MVFMVIHLIPGDAAAVLAGPNATPEALEAIRKDMGLDQPLLVQYVVWVGHLLQGDLGKSTLSGQPIIKLLQARAPATIQLTVAAMFISMIIAVPLGILSATHVRGKLEWVISTIQSLWLAIPNFWAGILAIIVFSLVLRWLPPGGRVADGNDIGDSIKSLILPATTLGLCAGGEPVALHQVQPARGVLRRLRAHRARQGPERKAPSCTATRCATRCCR